MERVAGIEPAQQGRKHCILPLNYTRKLLYALYNFIRYFSSFNANLMKLN